MTAAVAEHTGPRDGFVHLHVHTEYSMLYGAARLKDMFAECQRAGMPAVAMTDHGNLYGAYDFWSTSPPSTAGTASRCGGAPPPRRTTTCPAPVPTRT